jgi:hypothetical protein
MINSQTAAGSTIELFGYRDELPTEREYEGLKQLRLKRIQGTFFYPQLPNGQL